MLLRHLDSSSSINSDELAYILFPSNKYPKRAFTRAVKIDKKLDSDQVDRLSVYLGVDPYKIIEGKIPVGFSRQFSVSISYQNNLYIFDIENRRGFRYYKNKKPVLFEGIELSAFIRIIVNQKVSK